MDTRIAACHKGRNTAPLHPQPLKYHLLTAIGNNDLAIHTITPYYNFCIPCFSLQLVTETKKAKAPPFAKVRSLLKPTDFNLINIPSYKILLRRYVSQEHKTIKL